jgi:hypothetical protein
MARKQTKRSRRLQRRTRKHKGGGCSISDWRGYAIRGDTIYCDYKSKCDYGARQRDFNGKLKYPEIKKHVIGAPPGERADDAFCRTKEVHGLYTYHKGVY